MRAGVTCLAGILRMAAAGIAGLRDLSAKGFADRIGPARGRPLPRSAKAFRVTAALCTLAASPAAAETWRFVYSDFPPFSHTTEDGTATGFAIELARAAAVDAGVEIRFFHVRNPEEAIALIDSGGADIHPHLVPTDARRAVLDFTSPYEAVRIFAYRRDDAREMNTETFEGLRIGVLAGSANAAAARDYPLATIIPLTSYGDLFAAGLEGAVDVFFVPDTAFARFTELFGIDAFTKARPEPIQHRDVAMGVAKAQPEIVAALDRALENLRGSDTYWAIHDKFMGTREMALQRDVVLRIVGIMALVAGVTAATAVAVTHWFRVKSERLHALNRAEVERGLREELERSHDKLLDMVQSLEQSNAELDSFAYVASHDLKAPLRVIDNAAQWLAEDLEPHLTEDTRESMDLLRGRVRRMERLLDDLLEHSRIGRVKLSTKLVTGAEIEAEIRGLIRCPPDFEISFGKQFARISMPMMPIKQVLLNLVSNAIKHHDRDTGRVTVDVVEHAQALEFIVADDGPGIAPKYHDRVFEMFQTLKPRDQVDASGIGLAMVRKQVDLIGGDLTLTSDGVRGTQFRILWPRTADGVSGTEKMAS